VVSLIVVSGLLSERVVRSLRVGAADTGRDLREERRADRAFRVRNVSRRRRATRSEIRQGRRTARPPAASGSSIDSTRAEERSFSRSRAFPKRGRRSFAASTSSAFPFGLFEKTRIVPAELPCVVTRRSAAEGARAPLRNRSDRASQAPARREMIAFAEAPDDGSSAHSLARLGSLGEWVVTEQARALERPVAIFFDSRGVAGDAFESASSGPPRCSGSGRAGERARSTREPIVCDERPTGIAEQRSGSSPRLGRCHRRPAGGASARGAVRSSASGVGCSVTASSSQIGRNADCRGNVAPRRMKLSSSASFLPRRTHARVDSRGGAGDDARGRGCLRCARGSARSAGPRSRMARSRLARPRVDREFSMFVAW